MEWTHRGRHRLKLDWVEVYASILHLVSTPAESRMYTVPQYSASIGASWVRVVALYRAHAHLTGTTSACQALGLQTVSHGDSPTLWALSCRVTPRGGGSRKLIHYTSLGCHLELNTLNPNRRKSFFLDRSYDSIDTYYTRLMAVSHHRM